MSMAYIAIAVTVIGAGIAYTGQQQAAKAAEQQGDMEKDAAEQSARNLEIQTAETVRRERLNNRRRLARLRSSMNAGGVTMSDSSMDVFAETAATQELAIQDIGREGNLQSQNKRAAGNMAQWESKALASATRVQSYGTLLSSASSATTTYRTS
jgi:hypothetical protein